MDIEAPESKRLALLQELPWYPELFQHTGLGCRLPPPPRCSLPRYRECGRDYQIPRREPQHMASGNVPGSIFSPGGITACKPKVHPACAAEKRQEKPGQEERFPKPALVTRALPVPIKTTDKNASQRWKTSQRAPRERVISFSTSKNNTVGRLQEKSCQCQEKGGGQPFPSR